MTKDRKILIFENSYKLSNYLLKYWNELAQNSIYLSGRFNVVLSGGRTPSEFYTKLSSLEDFDLWSKVHIFWADERFVPLEHHESNFRMIKENLLNFINIPRSNIHYISAEEENAGIAAEKYKNEIVKWMDFSRNGLLSFDLVLLGIGEDGHTASLMPGYQGINDQGRITLPVSENYLKYDRISITLPVINNAKHVMFLVLGAKKADIVQKVFGEDGQLPAQMVAPVNGDLTVLLDREAASKLTFRETFTHEGDAISIIT